jgi:hypothetical protein
MNTTVYNGRQHLCIEGVNVLAKGAQPLAILSGLASHELCFLDTCLDNLLEHSLS